MYIVYVIVIHVPLIKINNIIILLINFMSHESSLVDRN